VNLITSANEDYVLWLNIAENVCTSQWTSVDSRAQKAREEQF